MNTYIYIYIKDILDRAPEELLTKVSKFNQ